MFIDEHREVYGVEPICRVLPANLFTTTGIPVAILIFDRSREQGGPSEDRRDVMFIDASREFTPGKAVNSLSDEHLAKILDTYRERATEVFERRIDAVLQSFPNPDIVAPTGQLIRRLSGRWGSMTPTARLILNLDLVKKPTPCIDYVITHELCHRIEHHHGPTFWALLDRVMPEWRKRKERLEHGGFA